MPEPAPRRPTRPLPGEIRVEGQSVAGRTSPEASHPTVASSVSEKIWVYHEQNQPRGVPPDRCQLERSNVMASRVRTSPEASHPTVASSRGSHRPLAKLTNQPRGVPPD